MQDLLLLGQIDSLVCGGFWFEELGNDMTKILLLKPVTIRCVFSDNGIGFGFVDCVSKFIHFVFLSKFIRSQTTKTYPIYSVESTHMHRMSAIYSATMDRKIPHLLGPFQPSLSLQFSELSPQTAHMHRMSAIY